MTPELPSDVSDRLIAGEDVTKEDLRALKGEVSSLDDARVNDVDGALAAFEARNAGRLGEDAGTKSALLDLRRTIMDRRAGTIERAGRQAGEMLDTTARRAKAIGYRQWLELTHPERSTSTKIMQGLGILAAAYGVYRVARWVVGKPKQSFLGKLFKFAGVAAIAGYAINALGAPLEAASAPSSAPSAPGGADLAVDDPALESKGDLLKNPARVMVDGIPVAFGKDATGAETLLNVGGKNWRIAMKAGPLTIPAGGALTSAVFARGEYRLEGTALGITRTGYVSPAELTRVVRAMNAASGTYETEVVYHDKPAGTAGRTEQKMSLRFDRAS